jgi:YesN/AraC family two-component response regulator
MDDLKKLQELCRDYSILYVEDNDALRSNAKKLLHKFFPVVNVAKDGKDGLEKFKEHPCPIVITDIKMPNMDGITFFKAIKEISPKTEVIVISAYDEREYLLEMIEHGVFKFLKKPINVESFTKMLFAVVNKLKAEQAVSIAPKVENISQDEPIMSAEEQEESILHDTKIFFKVLKELHENDEKIELHNYYKGLSITKDAKILEVTDDSIEVLTSPMQQKAMWSEKQTYIVSHKLPLVMLAESISRGLTAPNAMKLAALHFVRTSPIKRDSLRVQPKGQYILLIFVNDEVLDEKYVIEDISIRSIRISTKALRAGLRDSKDIRIKVNLDKGTFIIDTPVILFRIDEKETHYDLVFLFENVQKAEFMKYMTKRQMEIIREFKGIYHEQ